MQWLHKLNLHLQALTQFRVLAASHMAAMSQLVQGRLTIDIIVPQHLKAIITDINKQLEGQGSSLHIQADVSLFYKQQDMVTVTHDTKFVYVKIRIPLSSPTTQFALYKIDAVPVPTSQDNVIYTIITQLPEWIAISLDTKSYISLSHKEVQHLRAALNTRNYLPRSQKLHVS